MVAFDTVITKRNINCHLTYNSLLFAFLCTQALVVGPPDKPDSQLLLFPYIQRLKLAAGLSTVSMRSIFYMLKISPCIEYLQFEVEVSTELIDMDFMFTCH